MSLDVDRLAKALERAEIRHEPGDPDEHKAHRADAEAIVSEYQRLAPPLAARQIDPEELLAALRRLHGDHVPLAYAQLIVAELASVPGSDPGVPQRVPVGMLPGQGAVTDASAPSLAAGAGDPDVERRALEAVGAWLDDNEGYSYFARDADTGSKSEVGDVVPESFPTAIVRAALAAAGDRDRREARNELTDIREQLAELTEDRTATDPDDDWHRGFHEAVRRLRALLADPAGPPVETDK
jgi:hypothetical protein